MKEGLCCRLICIFPLSDSVLLCREAVPLTARILPENTSSRRQMNALHRLHFGEGCAAASSGRDCFFVIGRSMHHQTNALHRLRFDGRCTPRRSSKPFPIRKPAFSPLTDPVVIVRIFPFFIRRRFLNGGRETSVRQTASFLMLSVAAKVKMRFATAGKSHERCFAPVKINPHRSPF